MSKKKRHSKQHDSPEKVAQGSVPPESPSGAFGHLPRLPPGVPWDPGPELNGPATFTLLRSDRLRMALSGWKAPLGVAIGVVGLYAWWCVNGARGSDYQSAQWVYSAIFQGSAALTGLAALVVTVLWGQAVTSRAALAGLVRRYADIAFERTNVELYGTKLSRIIVFINQIGGAIKDGT